MSVLALGVHATVMKRRPNQRSFSHHQCRCLGSRSGVQPNDRTSPGLLFPSFCGLVWFPAFELGLKPLIYLRIPLTLRRF